MWITAVIELLAKVGIWFMGKAQDRKEAEKVFGDILKSISDHTERMAKDRRNYDKAKNENKQI